MLDQPFPTTPFAWYRVTFRSKAGQDAMIAAVSLDAAGKPLDADHHTGLDASADWAEQSFCTRGKAGATHAVIRVNPPGQAECVRDVSVEPIERSAVADWADRVWAAMPPLDYAPPPDRWRSLPKTRSLLQSRGTRHAARIVMLGDSIVNDTSSSQVERLLGRAYPACKVEKVTSVRGSTGCWWYKDENRVEEWVLKHKPDLLMIGGISQRDDVDAIREVIKQVRAKAPEVEVLLMTGAFGATDPRKDKAWTAEVPAEGTGYRTRLMKLAAEEKCGFLDMTGAWGRYIRESQYGMGWFKRDPIHANERGFQILGRILAAFLGPEK